MTSAGRLQQGWRSSMPHRMWSTILNHVSGAFRGVAAVYNRHAYLEERGAALEAWGRYVEGLVRSAPVNIVPMMAVH